MAAHSAPRPLRGLLFACLVAIILIPCASRAYAWAPAGLTGDVRYERPFTGYEGTYEWRGNSAYTYVYDWTTDVGGAYGVGQHVSSIYIQHPSQLKFMEIGINRFGGLQPTIFVSWCNGGATYIQDKAFVTPGTSPKLLIRNMTMGNPDDTWERWIMSWNDVTQWDQNHILTYGQAWSSSESYYRGDDNRAYFYTQKRTSKPANWTDWTASVVKADGDDTHYFYIPNHTKWYNKNNGT